MDVSAVRREFAGVERRTPSRAMIRSPGAIARVATTAAPCGTSLLRAGGSSCMHATDHHSIPRSRRDD